MPSDQVVARVYERFSGGQLYEQALLSIWFLVIGLPIATVTPFRYLFILYFLSFFLFDSKNVVSGVVSAWWIIPFLGVALLSVFWSPYASDALRTAVLLILSMVVIIVVAARFTPQQIVRCMVFSLTGVLVFFFVQPIPIEYGASFGSKNYLALFMLTGFVLCFTTALDRSEFIPIRLLALVLAPVFASIVIRADSTTTLFMLMISGAFILGMRILLIDLRSVRNLTSLLIVLGLAVSLLTVYAALTFLDQEFIDSFLGAFGKDSSFTGRTALWEEAQNQIGMRPYLGVGLEGFWQYDVGSAQTLNENDFKPFGTKLTFHNVHLEVLVHLGIIGYGCFLLAMAAVLWFSIKRLVTNPDMTVIGLCAIILVGLISSNVESALWSGFNVQSFLFFVSGAAYARGRRRRHFGNIMASPV